MPNTVFSGLAPVPPRNMTTRHARVHLTWGRPRVFLSMFLAAAGFRFDGESTIPPQAGNASRWAANLIDPCKVS
jgi:hypothetical protein